MRFGSLVPVVAVCVLAACSDKQLEKTATTAPGKPRLSLQTLPNTASSVCRANVAARDRLVIKGGDQSQLTALDAVIDDVCN